ncbi:uncharacterized protein TRIADDRAFT_61469 [Trichoplax adhaerens]|uniref:Uncharacterized protein n=1 Tax=Trichoplax adhaerens TaxID=10228 RepID=B3SB27_TRIAD|nr:predicted protein [Trichoplax adhaerens]EDV20089.1 predicted protein [Trichoplax adhaerens]|eukprot:XP_002117473.1 predicted protein [Trichoplax adhaerens]
MNASCIIDLNRLSIHDNQNHIQEPTQDDPFASSHSNEVERPQSSQQDENTTIPLWPKEPKCNQDEDRKIHPSLAQEIDDLVMKANQYEEQELYDQCLCYYNKVLSLSIKRYGRSHRRVLDIYCAIGKLQLILGLIEESLWSHYQVLKVCTEHYNNDNLLMAMAYYLVGESVASMDRCESLLFFKESLEILLNYSQEVDDDNEFAISLIHGAVMASRKCSSQIASEYGYFILTLLSSINHSCIEIATTEVDIHFLTCEVFHLKLESLDLLALSEAIISSSNNVLEADDHLSDEIGFNIYDGNNWDFLEESKRLEHLNQWQRQALISTAASHYDRALQLYYMIIGAVQCSSWSSSHLELYITSQIAALHYWLAKEDNLDSIQHLELSHKMYQAAGKLSVSIYPQSYVMHQTIHSGIEKCASLMEMKSEMTRKSVNPIPTPIANHG